MKNNLPEETFLFSKKSAEIYWWGNIFYWMGETWDTKLLQLAVLLINRIMNNEQYVTMGNQWNMHKWQPQNFFFIRNGSMHKISNERALRCWQISIMRLMVPLNSPSVTKVPIIREKVVELHLINLSRLELRFTLCAEELYILKMSQRNFRKK